MSHDPLDSELLSPRNLLVTAARDSETPQMNRDCLGEYRDRAL